VDVRLAISRLLLIGIVISFLLIIVGGILYLSQHSNTIVNYQNFHGEPVLLTSFLGIVSDALSLEPRGIIQLGLLVLFFVQILRVALTAWYFLKDNDQFFTGISLFILSILMLTLFWRF
jgi:uncharacterized membrane protein